MAIATGAFLATQGSGQCPREKEPPMYITHIRVTLYSQHFSKTTYENIRLMEKQARLFKNKKWKKKKMKK